MKNTDQTSGRILRLLIFYRTNQFKKQIEVVRVLYGMSNWVGIL